MKHTHSLYDIDVILAALDAYCVKGSTTANRRQRATRLIKIISDGFETVTYPQE